MPVQCGSETQATAITLDRWYGPGGKGVLGAGSGGDSVKQMDRANQVVTHNYTTVIGGGGYSNTAWEMDCRWWRSSAAKQRLVPIIVMKWPVKLR